MRPRSVLAPVAVLAVVAGAFVVRDHEQTPPAAAETATTTPTEVTPTEFCEGFDDLAGAREALLAAASADTVRSLRATTSRVADLAAGTTMPDDAKAGVAFLERAFLALPDDATGQDVVDSDATATLADERHAEALSDYIALHCVRQISAAR